MMDYISVLKKLFFIVAVLKTLIMGIARGTYNYMHEIQFKNVSTQLHITLKLALQVLPEYLRSINVYYLLQSIRANKTSKELN